MAVRPTILPSLLLALSLDSAVARAEMLEDTEATATMGASGNLFSLNPGESPMGKTRAALGVSHLGRKTVLDHSAEGRDKISTAVNDNAAAVAAVTDIGDGLQFGLTGENAIKKVATIIGDGSQDQVETFATSQAAGKVVLALTDELHAGLEMRYLHRNATLWGAPNLAAGLQTRYKASLIGFGSGVAYAQQRFGLGYAYYPPMQGKTEVSGEERIVTEPGEIAADGFFRPTTQLTVGLMVKRWLTSPDDLGHGTTAPDNKTAISLYGLDPDQYVQAQQQIAVGADFAVTSSMTLRGAYGREQATFGFDHSLQYQGVEANQNSALTLATDRLTGAMRLTNGLLQVDAGATYYKRKSALPEDWGGGSYQAAGVDLYGTAGLTF